MNLYLTYPLACACKPYAFKQAHTSTEIFVHVRKVQKVNEITGLNCIIAIYYRLKYVV